jgi:cyclopropane-fatty-acyl-phospholipid synthase
MWEYYLAAVEVGFLTGSNMVFQLLLSTRMDAVPLLRDFMVDEVRTGSGTAAVPADEGHR